MKDRAEIISSASVWSIPFLSFIEPIFAWNIPLVSLIFLKRSLVFLISPCYSLKLCIQMGISLLLFLCLSLLFFSQLFVRPPQTNTLPFCISFFLGMILITTSCTVLGTSIHSSSGTLSIRYNPLNMSLPLCNHKEFDLGMPEWPSSVPWAVHVW